MTDDQPHLQLETPLPCLICGVELKPAWGGEPCAQPYKGLMCYTRGNYGSTVFDPMSISVVTKLEFNICDDCLVARAARVRLGRYMPQPDLELCSKIWDPTQAWD